MTDIERQTVDVDQLVARAPRRLRPATAWLVGSPLGRPLLRFAGRFGRLEMLDRSMTVAAEIFISVFPVLIMTAVLLGSRYSDGIADTIGLPEETRGVLQEALNSTDASAFGVLGAFLVLVSATSLSRALTRAFAAIWELPRPRTGLRYLWRALGSVLLLVAGALVVRWLSRVTGDWTPEIVAGYVVPFVLTAAVAASVPWLLLSGRVPVRLLVPGAFLFGLVMVASRPISRPLLADALQDSADRYGSIGVAFTYIAFLYALALCFLGTALAGQVIATDEGELGQRVRG
ncbi:YhjD/YihY/BrkB family envelope integrity protein [Jiangella muralis]|uniref:YhjD/YihY/BrkB family envelope integrity protein n=1 Tax=Jiangella muralis TaxID=702383 RepID=UPI00069D4778|nr:YhjD/YihY/BrkB family envelope integrity protein [Jiangella muralis]